jgi:hypothetical protein
MKLEVRPLFAVVCGPAMVKRLPLGMFADREGIQAICVSRLFSKGVPR